MQIYKGILISRFHYEHNKKNSLLLFCGAISVAILMIVISSIFGELAALMALSFFIFALVSILDFRVGILLAIFFLPLTATQQIPREVLGIRGLNPLNVSILMSIFSMFFVQAVDPRTLLIPKFPRYFWLYIGTLIFAGIHGAIYSSLIPSYFLHLKIITFDSTGGYLRDILLKPIIILFVAFMLSIAIANARRPSNYLIPFFLSTLTLPIMVIGYVFMSGVSLASLASSEKREFLSALGIHSNELGYIFNTAFALSLCCFFDISSKFGKLLLGIVIAILIPAIMLTFSRGAYLGVLAVIGYLLYTQRKIYVTATISILIVVAALALPQSVIQRATTGISSNNAQDISAGRVDKIWTPLLPEILNSPVIGHGLSSILWSEAAERREILPVGHPHSAYLGLFLDFGILGAIFIFLFFRHMWRLFARIGKFHPEPIWRGFFKGATACILVMLVQGITDDSFSPSLPQTFLWLAYGIAIGLAARSKKMELTKRTSSTTQLLA